MQVKYSEEDINSLRDYMVDNVYTRQSPMKDDTLVKKDLYGDAMRDSEDGRKIMIQRVLISVCPRQLHVLMLKSETEGGYPAARDPRTNEVCYSLSTIVAYWPNWLTVMNNSHMSVCACKTCTETDGLHEAYCLKRREIVNKTETQLKEMRRGRARDKLERESFYVTRI